ncbi:unnamed protein product [Phytomonas sp. EM1]|nr:unnamed protein product [Phytomonas sp. EM1]|eukprot:CCW63455.1 unnamed protein product [Phytomonas sp. isolate EM1]
MTDHKSNVKESDISIEMQTDALEVAIKAAKEHQMEKDIAARIKREFDKRYHPTWQCIVGRTFGADIAYESKHFIFFNIGQLSVLLWKTS